MGPAGRLRQLQELGILLLVGKQKNAFSLMGGWFIGTIWCGNTEFEDSLQHVARFHCGRAVDVEFGSIGLALQL